MAPNGIRAKIGPERDGSKKQIQTKPDHTQKDRNKVMVKTKNKKWAKLHHSKE